MLDRARPGSRKIWESRTGPGLRLAVRESLVPKCNILLSKMQMVNFRLKMMSNVRADQVFESESSNS